MALCTFEFFNLRAFYLSHPEIEYRKLKCSLAFLTGLGCIISLVPHTWLHGFHSLGAAFLFGGLWGLTVLHLAVLWKEISPAQALLGHFLLQPTIIGYAILYAFDAESKQLAQKIAVFCIFLVVVPTCRALVKYSEAPEISASSIDEQIGKNSFH